MTDYTKPLPRPSTETKPFWDGAKAHQLLIQKCNDCGKFWFPPST
ncbi:MAG: zinc ribbon domain-containing protein, partial [Alphaproteobacteria bacterium]